MGTPIGRERMVRLFSTILRHDEDGKYYLVTPVEKVGITVDDAPFMAVELEVEQRGPEQSLIFRTNVDDVVRCNTDHPLRFEPEEHTGGIKPYLYVRRELWAKVTRALFFDLVEIGEVREQDGARLFGVRSAGAFFSIAPETALEGFS
jgi:hypothetical protein